MSADKPAATKSDVCYHGRTDCLCGMDEDGQREKPAATTKPCSPCGDGDTEQQYHAHATGSGDRCTSVFDGPTHYRCELPAGHENAHNSRCDNAQFVQVWPNVPTPPASTVTRTRTEEIRARVEKATPGPWTKRFFDIHSAERRVAGVTMEHLHYGPPMREVMEEQQSLDAEFIAHARSDVPYLLEENKRLRDALLDYAPHKRGCMVYGSSEPFSGSECTCGAWAALTPSPAQEKK